MEQAIGELVTCSRCAGTWVAAGLAATQILAPRFGRLLTWSLGAAAANDFLQAGVLDAHGEGEPAGAGALIPAARARRDATETPSMHTV